MLIFVSPFILRALQPLHYKNRGSEIIRPPPPPPKKQTEVRK